MVFDWAMLFECLFWLMACIFTAIVTFKVFKVMDNPNKADIERNEQLHLISEKLEDIDMSLLFLQNILS